MQLDPRLRRPGCGSSLTIRSARPTRRRCGLRARASAGRCGSRPRSQTAGRGRRGRTWVSEPGNLYASLLLTDPSPPDRVPSCRSSRRWRCTTPSADASRGLPRRVVLKWPNDLLIDRSKFAGILVEGEGAAVVDRHRRQLRASSGRHRIPRDRSGRGRRPRDAGKPVRAAVSRDDGAARAMGSRRGICRDPRRLARARRGPRQAGPRASRRGRACRPFEAIDDSGRLVLRLADGTMQTVAAGDVFMAAR